MEKELIKRWNSVVRSEDLVYFLGDFAMAGVEKKKELVSRLNGVKHMIMGNHDGGTPAGYRAMGFDEVSKYPIIVDKFYILSHEPLFMNDRMPYVNIHGHTHNNSYDSTSLHFNASVECINYTPILFDVVKAKFREADDDGGEKNE